MGLKIQYPEGATPLDPDDAQGLIPTHITTQRQLNEWEFINVVTGRGMGCLVLGSGSCCRMLPMVKLFTRRCSATLGGGLERIRTKETLPVGVAPENIRPELDKLLADIQLNLITGTMPIGDRCSVPPPNGFHPSVPQWQRTICTHDC